MTFTITDKENSMTYWLTSLTFSHFDLRSFIVEIQKSQGSAVVTCTPSTYEVCSSIPGPSERKSVVAYRWSAVYSTEP